MEVLPPPMQENLHFANKRQLLTWQLLTWREGGLIAIQVSANRPDWQQVDTSPGDHFFCFISIPGGRGGGGGGTTPKRKPLETKQKQICFA